MTPSRPPGPDSPCPTRRLAVAVPTEYFNPNWPKRFPEFISHYAAMDVHEVSFPQRSRASASLPMDTDSCTSAPANPARRPEAGADSIPTISQECPPQKRETEPELGLFSLELRAPAHHKTGGHDPDSSMRIWADVWREWKYWGIVRVELPDGGPRLTMPHSDLRTTPTGHTADQTVGRGMCPFPAGREMAPRVPQDVEHLDLEKSAPRDDPGGNTGIFPVRKRARWDSGLCRSATVSERPPKRLVLALLGVSTAGAVLMAQWRLGDPQKQPDHPRSQTAQHRFLWHPAVLVLGISLHVAALTLVYHLNGSGRRQDVFLIPITGATATAASLLGLEMSTILLRATPWASIAALCASTYGESG